MEWNRAAIEGLKALLAQRDPKLTYSQIAKLLDISPSAVSGAVHRHITLALPKRKPGPRKGTRNPNAVFHQNLVEPWAEFHARRKKERAEAKAAALQVTSVGQDSD